VFCATEAVLRNACEGTKLIGVKLTQTKTQFKYVGQRNVNICFGYQTLFKSLRYCVYNYLAFLVCKTIHAGFHSESNRFRIGFTKAVARNCLW
jgi:hypothetical protein